MFLNLVYGDYPKVLYESITYTGIFVLLSTLSLTIESILNVVAAFDSSFFGTAVYNSFLFEQNPVVTVKGDYIAVTFITFTLIFYLLATLSMISSWYQVISRVSRFETLQWQAKMKVWSMRVKVFMAILLLIILILLIGRYFISIVMISFFVIIILSITCAVVGELFISTLVKFKADKDESAALSISLIQSSFFMYRVCGPMFCIFFVMYFVLFAGLDYEEDVELIGAINLALFFRDIAIFFAVGALLHSSWYVNSVTEGALLDTSPVSCLFAHWDDKNMKIMGAMYSSEAGEHPSKSRL